MSQHLETASDLDLFLQPEEGEPAVLIDVRLADDFGAGHLPGAKNNCVYEVDFGKRMSRVAPHPAVPVIVYGAASNSSESSMAADKLERMGYEKVYDFLGGIAEWTGAERDLETSEGAEPVVPQLLEAGRYQLDLEESFVKWTGRNLINSHRGTVAITNGWIEVGEGCSISGGEVQLDMNQMTCSDLRDSMHDVLIEHLQSDDFFDTGRYPDARFVITRARHIPSTEDGAQNLHVTGGATIKGQTHPIAFDLSAGLTDEGLPAAQGVISLDRTRWGVIYGSGKFFKRLAGHLVNDTIELELRLLTKKA